MGGCPNSSNQPTLTCRCLSSLSVICKHLKSLHTPNTENNFVTQANMLLDIWRHMREDIDPGEPHDRDIPFPLHEPPGVRDRLVYEIKFLLEHLHQRFVLVYK